MDFQQMYNQSAMLKDAFLTRSNEATNENEKQRFQELASDQQAITDRLKSENEFNH